MIRHASSYSIFLLRLVSGALFALHGLQHVFGILTQSPPSPPLSLPWFAGILELVGGTLIAAGLLTRPTAFLLSGEMAAAYFIVMRVMKLDDFDWLWSSAAMAVGVALVVTIGLGLLGTWRVLGQRPAPYLRNS